MNDDFISRQGAVSRFSDLLMVELKGKRLPTWDEVYNAMQDVPSEDVQPVRHGHWIKHSPCQYECNKCGKVVVADDANELNYCCNCGRIMDGEQNG